MRDKLARSPQDRNLARRNILLTKGGTLTAAEQEWLQYLESKLTEPGTE